MKLPNFVVEELGKDVKKVLLGNSSVLELKVPQKCRKSVGVEHVANYFKKNYDDAVSHKRKETYLINSEKNGGTEISIYRNAKGIICSRVLRKNFVLGNGAKQPHYVLQTWYRYSERGILWDTETFVDIN